MDGVLPPQPNCRELGVRQRARAPIGALDFPTTYAEFVTPGLALRRHGNDTPDAVPTRPPALRPRPLLAAWNLSSQREFMWANPRGEHNG